MVCNVNIVYGNLKYENSQDYAPKPERNCTFMISAVKVSFCDSLCLQQYSRLEHVFVAANLSAVRFAGS